MNRIRGLMLAAIFAVFATMAPGAALVALAEDSVEAAAEAPGHISGNAVGMIAIAAGIAIGIAANGAGLGQGRGVAAAMESIGRNPNSADRILTPMILGLAFIEALAIYAFVIALLLVLKF